MPTKTRPAEVPVDAAVNRPPEPTTEQLTAAQSAVVTSTTVSDLDRPMFEPPGSAAGAATAAAAGWLTNKHILMLWQTTGALDSWAYYDGGTGWKQSTQSGDVAARGMGVLTAGARIGGGIVHAYEGAGGAIDAVYLW